MKVSTVTISNLTPGTGAVILQCDVRVDLDGGPVITIRDARLLESPSGGGIFVGMPRRRRGDGLVKSVEFEGERGNEILSAIREAMKRQIATPAELEADVLERRR